MPNEFTVIGEHKTDVYHLLVLGADGNYYEYDPVRGTFSLVDPDENWEFLRDVDEAIVEL